MQPRIVADLVIGQLDVQAKQTADQTELLKAFRAFPENIPKAEQQRLLRAAQDAYNQQFLPAWHKLHDYMVATYLPHVRKTDSILSMPGGRAAYTILIHEFTTTTTSAEEIHKLGEQDVARIEAAMLAIKKDSGFTGAIADFQKKMDADPAQHFHSKDEMLANSRNIAMIIEPELPNEFRHIPALLFGVRPIPPDREAASATNAQGGSSDLSKPGWFNLNTYQPEKQVRYDQESLVLHEAIPGHIFQGAIATQQMGLPELRRFYSNSAFGEGWALYAESLGAQLGLYEDPYSHFGQLASERFRAVRLVVDTGIHDLGWTRQQALDYFKIHSPQTPVAEVDRYISWPAQALSYKMGELRIRALRDKAQQQLGNKFDIRDFNDAVIREGRLLPDILSGPRSTSSSPNSHSLGSVGTMDPQAVSPWARDFQPRNALTSVIARPPNPSSGSLGPARHPPALHSRFRRHPRSRRLRRPADLHRSAATSGSLVVRRARRHRFHGRQRNPLSSRPSRRPKLPHEIRA